MYGGGGSENRRIFSNPRSRTSKNVRIQGVRRERGGGGKLPWSGKKKKKWDSLQEKEHLADGFNPEEWERKKLWLKKKKSFRKEEE